MRTFYAIYNSDNSLVFVNNNTACFAELFELDSRISETFSGWKRENAKSLFADFMSGKYLEFPVDNRVSNRRLTKFLSEIGNLFGEFEILPLNSDDPICEKHSIEKISSKYKVRAHYNNFESPEKFKMAIHCARIAIESPSFIDENLLDNKPDGMDFWQWIRILATRKVISHNYFSLGFGYDIAINDPIEAILGKVKEVNFLSITNVYWNYQAQKERIIKDGEKFVPKEEVYSRQVELAKKHYLEYHKKVVIPSIKVEV